MPKAAICTHCKFEAKNKAGLSAHTRIKHKDEKKAVAKKVVHQKSATKKVAPKQHVNHGRSLPKPKMPSICVNCHALPAGSIELTGLLLVLVFSLTAVLFTSIYALETQQNRIDILETELSVYQAQ